MSNIKALDKLRESSHLDDYKWTLETGEIINEYGSKPSDPNAVNWGERWRKIADEIEREVSERFCELPVDEDGITIHVGDMVQGLGDSGPVQHLELWDDAWVVVFEFAPGQFTRYSGDAVRHVKPRTIEDVLEDFVRNGVEPISRENREVDLSDVAFCIDKGEMRKYAAEIRELMGVGE